MKNYIFFIVLFITSLSINAQTIKPGEETKVNETITKFFNGIAELDILKIKLYSTKDLMILESGMVWNIDSLANVLGGYNDVNFKRINKFNFIRTEVRGTTAWVAYNNTADITFNGQKTKIDWLESAVLIKEDSDWKVQFLHSTVLQPKVN